MKSLITAVTLAALSATAACAPVIETLPTVLEFTYPMNESAHLRRRTDC